MKKIHLLSISILLATALMAAEENAPATESDAAEENCTAAQLLRACTRLMPTEALILTSEIRVRKPHGTVLDHFPCKLMLDWGAIPPTATLLALDESGQKTLERAELKRLPTGESEIKLWSGDVPTPETPSPAARVRGTDITWLDLSLDFLWWPNARFDDVPRGDSRNGRDCDIIVTVPPQPIPGCAAMRVWIDRKLRCILQAEQIGPQGNAVRRFWVQRVKKTDDRWMIKDLEVESIGSGHRTQLLVDSIARP